MERDVLRFDLHNTRVRTAVFSGGAAGGAGHKLEEYAVWSWPPLCGQSWEQVGMSLRNRWA